MPAPTFDLQSRHLIPDRQEVDVAAELLQSSVASEPSLAGAWIAAATVLTHVEAGRVSDDGAETMGS